VSSAGPFTATGVAASNLSVGSGVVVIFSSLAHLTASARFRARAQGPVSGRLCGTATWRERPSRPGFPLRFRCRHFASRSSDSRRGIGRSSRSAYRRRRSAPRTSTGSPRSARTSYGRGGCLLYPEDDGAHPGLDGVPSRHLPLLDGQTLHLAPTSHPREPLLHEASVGGLRSSPVRPAARLALPGWNGRLLGLPFELRTPPLPAAHVEGAARSSSTDLELLDHISLILQSGSSLVSCDLASHPQERQGERWPVALVHCRALQHSRPYAGETALVALDGEIGLARDAASDRRWTVVCRKPHIPRRRVPSTHWSRSGRLGDRRR
jgi:hypothetical protein